MYNEKGESTGSNVSLPAVFRAPIRPDIVNFVHSEMRKNTRQPYAVSVKAGKFFFVFFFHSRFLFVYLIFRGQVSQMVEASGLGAERLKCSCHKLLRGHGNCGGAKLTVEAHLTIDINIEYMLKTFRCCIKRSAILRFRTILLYDVTLLVCL